MGSLLKNKEERIGRVPKYALAILKAFRPKFVNFLLVYTRGLSLSSRMN